MIDDNRDYEMIGDYEETAVEVLGLISDSQDRMKERSRVALRLSNFFPCFPFLFVFSIGQVLSRKRKKEKPELIRFSCQTRVMTGFDRFFNISNFLPSSDRMPGRFSVQPVQSVGPVRI